jgi:methyl-accepting chemotaxis protein
VFKAIQALIDDAAEMTRAALEGRIEHRADTAKHGGSFAMIMEGLNKTLDAVMDPIINALGVMKPWNRAISALRWKAIIRVNTL